MRKILSLILGLLWALPVWGACQNLYNESAVTDGYFYNADFEWTENASTYTTDFMGVAQGTYVLSVNKKANLSSPVNIRVNLFDANKVIKSQLVFSIDNGTTDLDIEISIPVDISYVRASSNPTFVTFESFLPINCVNSCRNLFDTNVVLGGTMSSNDGADGVPNPARARLEYLYLSAGTYTISNNGNTINQVIGASYSDDAGSNFSPIDVWNWHDLPFTFTLTSNRYVRFMVRNSSNVDLTNDNIGKFQFEQGSTATEYVPYCEKIKIATTKYNETKFSPLNTALANAISVVDTVVSNTITQAGRIATLQAQKQTRPNDIADDNEKCPAGKKCLLVEDASGIPHWYEIVEHAWDLPVGYTQLQYIESTGTQFIDTGIIATNWDWSVEFEMSVPQAGDMFFGAGRGIWASAEWGAQFGLANSSGNANWGAGSGGMNVVISNLGVRTNTFYNYKITKEGLYINGELKSQNTATKSFSNSDLSLWIFKTNNPGTSGYNKAGSSWKYVRIYNADTALVFNGVPAKNPDGKIGMYDKVSGEFFENKGTGDFVAGPVAQ